MRNGWAEEKEEEEEEEEKSDESKIVCISKKKEKKLGDQIRKEKIGSFDFWGEILGGTEEEEGKERTTPKSNQPSQANIKDEGKNV